MPSTAKSGWLKQTSIAKVIEKSIVRSSENGAKITMKRSRNIAKITMKRFKQDRRDIMPKIARC